MLATVVNDLFNPAPLFDVQIDGSGRLNGAVEGVVVAKLPVAHLRGRQARGVDAQPRTARAADELPDHDDGDNSGHPTDHPPQRRPALFFDGPIHAWGSDRSRCVPMGCSEDLSIYSIG